MEGVAFVWAVNAVERKGRKEMASPVLRPPR